MRSVWQSGLTVAVVLASAGAAAAGPLPWSYRVTTLGPPARVVAEGRGVLADEVRLDDMLSRPTSGPPALPDPFTYLWDTITESVSNKLDVRFTDDATGRHTYDVAFWAVRWDWKRSADRRSWEFLGEQDIFSVDDNYAGGNRYDLIVEDGDITLRMTPNVPNPNDLPEPGTLVLAGLGLGAAGVARLRRRIK